MENHKKRDKHSDSNGLSNIKENIVQQNTLIAKQQSEK